MKGTIHPETPGKRSGWLLIIAGLLLLVFFGLLHLAQGEAGLTVSRVVQALIQPAGQMEDHIVWSLRLPRTVIGLLAGGALAVAGVLLQSLTRNPLASAGTLGINAGAFFMLTLAAVFFPEGASSFSLLLTLIGGAGAGLFAYVLSGGAKSSPVRLVLSGMIVSLTLSALTGALQLFYENKALGLYFWGSGSLVQIDWSGITHAWPWILTGTAAAFLLARPLDIMSLGDESAASLGQNVTKIRTIGLLVAVLLAAVTVSVVGPIGFVGLIAPHLLRLLGCVRHRLLIPASFVWGGAVVLASDTIAMMFQSSLGQLPVGAVTALIGGPWLIWLASRTGRRSGGTIPRASGQTVGPALQKIPYLGWLLGLAVLLAVIVIGGQAFGGTRLPFADVFAVFAGGGSEVAQKMVLDLRLPRTLVAALAGAALALSGLLLQGVVRNPLADPSIIGITSGSGVGALILIVLFPQWTHLVPAAAFVGALATAAIIYMIASRSGLQPAVLALVGIAVSAMGAAVIQVLVIRAGIGASAALVWLSGSTYARGWAEIPQMTVFLLILLPLAYWAATKLDILQFTDESSSGLGLNPGRSRLAMGGIGVALAAAAVASVGTVGFIGLIAPHAVRMMAGPHHRKLIPLSVLLGAVLLVLADLVGRTVLAPKEIPSGLVAALIGAPYFLWLMYKTQVQIRIRK